MERRTFIVSTSVGAGAILAGCADAEEEDSDTNGDEDETNETGESDDNGSESEEDLEETDDDTELEDEGEEQDRDTESDDGTEGEHEAAESEEDESDETSEDADEDATDEEDVEEPSTSEIIISVADREGDPIENAEIHGEGEPHDAEIPLEFDAETGEDGVASTPIYENEYTIEADHPNYVSETIEHVHNGETEVAIELEADEPDPDEYENEILNETPLEVEELETQDGNGDQRCEVSTTVSHTGETTAQYDATFTAYYGEEMLAESSVPPRTIGGGASRTPSANFSDTIDACDKITHFVFEVDNYQEVDHEDRDVEGEVTTESAAEGVIEIEEHEFDADRCMINVDIANESSETTSGVVELIMYGEREHSNEMRYDFDPGEIRTHNFGANICAELESYEIRVSVE